MTSTMDLDTERSPLSEPLGVANVAPVGPFGLSVTRWEPTAKYERELVGLDPDSQVGYVGDRPVRDLITAATTCSYESDGKDAIALDWGVDDK